MIDFEWYRSFIHVYQQRSVSAAARIRFLTQPAVSQHIAALEAELETSLFIRAPRQMIPTDAGTALYTQVVGLIDRLEELSLEMKYEAGQQSRPVLKFGGPTEFVTHGIVPKLPLDVAQFTVVFDLTVPLLQRLLANELDFIIATKRIDEPGVQYVPIADERFHLIAPIGYDAPEADLKDWMDRQCWISYGLELPIIRRYYQTQFGERPGIRPEMILPNVDAILKAIEAGHGISVLPDYLVEAAVSARRVQRIAPERFATNQLYVAYRTDSRHDPVLQQVIVALQS